MTAGESGEGVVQRVRSMLSGESNAEDSEPDRDENVREDLDAAQRVVDRTQDEFIEALDDEELEGRMAYVAMESLGDWFEENASTALRVAAGDSDGK